MCRPLPNGRKSVIQVADRPPRCFWRFILLCARTGHGHAAMRGLRPSGSRSHQPWRCRGRLRSSSRSHWRAVGEAARCQFWLPVGLGRAGSTRQQQQQQRRLRPASGAHAAGAFARQSDSSGSPCRRRCRFRGMRAGRWRCLGGLWRCCRKGSVLDLGHWCLMARGAEAEGGREPKCIGAAEKIPVAIICWAWALSSAVAPRRGSLLEMGQFSSKLGPRRGARQGPQPEPGLLLALARNARRDVKGATPMKNENG
jgi:hypothetical protein